MIKYRKDLDAPLTADEVDDNFSYAVGINKRFFKNIHYDDPNISYISQIASFSVPSSDFTFSLDCIVFYDDLLSSELIKIPLFMELSSGTFDYGTDGVNYDLASFEFSLTFVYDSSVNRVNVFFENNSSGFSDIFVQFDFYSSLFVPKDDFDDLISVVV